MKILLRTTKASYVRTDKIDYRLGFRCKTCGEKLNSVHVSRRMRSRIVAKFCLRCFENLLMMENVELK